MERIDAEKLLKSYKSWWDDKPCDELNEVDNIFLDAYFNNCLEAKLKTLHSMKEGENAVCDECDGYGWVPDENGRRKDSCSKCK